MPPMRYTDMAVTNVTVTVTCHVLTLQPLHFTFPELTSTMRYLSLSFLKTLDSVMQKSLRATQ